MSVFGSGLDLEGWESCFKGEDGISHRVLVRSRSRCDFVPFTILREGCCLAGRSFRGVGRKVRSVVLEVKKEVLWTMEGVQR